MSFCLIWNTNDKRVQKSNKTSFGEQLKPKIETNGKKILFFMDLEFIDIQLTCIMERGIHHRHKHFVGYSQKCPRDGRSLRWGGKPLKFIREDHKNWFLSKIFFEKIEEIYWHNLSSDLSEGWKPLTHNFGPRGCMIIKKFSLIYFVYLSRMIEAPPR